MHFPYTILITSYLFLTEKAEKSNEESAPKPKVEIREVRRPLAHVNRARMNDEERQERRKQLFKQGSKRQTLGKKNAVIGIKGVRLNRRFELLMKNRNAPKKAEPTF